MTVLDGELVLGLVRGLHLGDGHADHVVVVAVGDQLVAAALGDVDGALIKKVLFVDKRKVSMFTCWPASCCDQSVMKRERSGAIYI